MPNLRLSRLPLLLLLLPSASFAADPAPAAPAPPATPAPAAGGSVKAEAPKVDAPKVDAKADANVNPKADPKAAPKAAAKADQKAASGKTEKVEAPKAPEPEPDEIETRERQLNEAMAISGSMGLLRNQYASSGAPGQIRLGFSTEYFTGNFLCTSTQWCKPPVGTGKVISDNLNHVGAHLALGVDLFKFLEVYLGTNAVANSDKQNRPMLLQTLGDSNIGVKVHLQAGATVHLGLASELWLLNGTGAVGVAGAGTSAKFRGLATIDSRYAKTPFPLRISANMTYSLDNSGDLVTDTEAARNMSITRIERFGLGINRVDHFDINLGVEGFLFNDRIRPFAEYDVMIPINRQGYECRADNISNDECLANSPTAPSRVSLGARFFPWRSGFSILAAADIGLTHTSRFIEEMQPMAPWMLHVGLGWATDTKDPGAMARRLPAFPKPKPRIRGMVHEMEKLDPLADAIVQWTNHKELTPLATDVDGRFRTHELEPGVYEFAVRSEGYNPGSCKGTIPAESTSPDDVVIDCPLTPLPRNGAVTVRVKDAETQAIVGNAKVLLRDSKQAELTPKSVDGAYRFADVALGAGELRIDADGYLSYVAPAEVKVGKESQIEVAIIKRPKELLISVSSSEITLKQQVQFASDSAVILPESNLLLSEVADAMIQSPGLKKVEVQGHTDNSGTPEQNQSLSEKRAQAVVGWLTAHGVQASRLVAKGYGQDRPIAPNITTAGKAKNRRVQLIVLEQGPGAIATTNDAPPPPAPPPAPEPKTKPKPKKKPAKK